MTKALITGITGMVGSHLLDYLLDNTGWEIHGMLRWRSPLTNIEQWLPQINRGDRIKLFYGDLTDAMSIDKVVSDSKPDIVFHLAAQSYPQVSFTNPLLTLDTNIQGTERLLGALRKYRPDAIIHICASSEVFGRVPREKLPINEECSFHPASPYAISKVGTDLVGRYYAEAYGMCVMTTRMFTHSVGRWTPIILRDQQSGLIDVKYISELRESGKRGGYFSGQVLADGTQVWDFAKHNLEIWDKNGWTKIRHLSCHPLGAHKLLEISTRGGIVDATDNHSIIGNGGQELVVGNLREGDVLASVPAPTESSTDMPESLAWLYGMFVAEGCETHGKLRIDNKDKSLLLQCQNALRTYLSCDSYLVASEHDMWRLVIRKPERYRPYFADCYAKDHNKRIPRHILNARTPIKLAFLRGYNSGDGRTHHPKLASEFVSFKTKSPILAMGLWLLAQEVTGRPVRIGVEHRGDARYYELRPLCQTGSERGAHRLKPDNEVVSVRATPYEGEVWDFETDSHTFNAGIGHLVVHNTGPRRGDVFAESTFAKQIAMIEQNKIPPIIKTGNLESLRTWADVRDAVRAYHMLVTVKPTPGAYYNIGGEHVCTVREMLDTLLKKAHFDGCDIQTDPTRLRPIDADLQVPDTTKFRTHTGWSPVIPFDKTMQDLLDYWRERVRKQEFLTR